VLGDTPAALANWRSEAVGPARVRDDDFGGRSDSVGVCQRQAVDDVRPHREGERLALAAGEQPDPNRAFTAHLRGGDPVHAVDDPHRGSMYEDRRQWHLDLGQHPDVSRILSVQARRLRRRQGVDRDDLNLPRLRRGHQVNLPGLRTMTPVSVLASDSHASGPL
jgi:hypothetical protein